MRFRSTHAKNRTQPTLHRVLLATLVLAAFYGCSRTPPRPAFEAYPQPTQSNLKGEQQPVELPHGAVALPRAQYAITAHVMSTKAYTSTEDADLPLDLALAWGEAAGSAIQANLSIRQANRWYWWEWKNKEHPASPSTQKMLSDNMANVHVLALDREVLTVLKKLDPGDTVYLSGELVDIKHPLKGLIRTSMRRDDSGAGACEILLVHEIKVWEK